MAAALPRVVVLDAPDSLFLEFVHVENEEGHNYTPKKRPHGPPGGAKALKLTRGIRKAAQAILGAFMQLLQVVVRYSPATARL